MEISFTSLLTPVTSNEFAKRTASVNRDGVVDYPWSIASSRVAKDVITYRICDCSACLITDGEKALLKHLLPANEDNHNFKKVFKFISDNMDLNNPNLQAVLVGSKPTAPSRDIFNKFLELLNGLHIPTTILKDGKGPTHIAYRTCTDEVLISNPKIDQLLNKKANNRDAIYNGFEYVKISNCDYI
ncbi:hypothetical protein J6P92_05480 [bacterium]|nr:hypothetical protein [bacterium]